MADRVAVMDSGVLQQVGTPHQVFREPRTRFVAEFVGANNIFTGQVQATGAEEAEIATPQGLFLVRQPVGRPLAPGATATFIVGADRLRIAGVAESAPNRLAGIVTAVEYVGSVVTAYLTLPDDTEVRLQAPESAVGALPPGARLAIAWAAADAFVLPEP
jgi:spermidine/putrescine transport system ATP-binding protein